MSGLSISGTQITIAPSGGVKATHNIIVNTTGQIANASTSIGNNTTSRRSDWSSPEGAITNLRPVYWWNWMDSTGVRASSTLTIKMYCEYPADVFHPVLWGGNLTRQFTSAAGNRAATADIIISSVTGQPLVIPKNTKFWWRTVNVSGGSVATFPIIQRPANHTTLGLDDGVSVGVDLGNSGTIAASAAVNSFGPTSVIGTVMRRGARAFFIVGDSLVNGQGDITSVGSQGSSSWIGRGLDGRHAHTRLGINSMTAQTLTGTAGSAAFLEFLPRMGFTDFIYEAGINDLTIASRTTAQILADQQTFYTAAKAANAWGVARLWQTTITARTTSTDSWATAGNQTPVTGQGTYSQTNVNDLNASIRAKPAQLYGVIDAMAYDATTLTSVIHDGPFPPTTDGTHFTSAKAADIGSRLVVAL